MNILHEADRLTTADRNRDYGPPHEDFRRVAAYWSNLFGIEIRVDLIPLAMVLLKVARQQHCPKRDNLVDIAGYARTAEMLDDPPREPVTEGDA